MCSIDVRKLLCCLVALALVLGASTVALAAPLASYTFDYYGNPVPATQAYKMDVVIDGSSLGTTPLREPRDVVVAKTGDVFIADTGNNRILQLNRNFELIQVIEDFEIEGVRHSFNAPIALYVTEHGRLYIADRDNARLVELTTSGDFVRVIGPPQTELKGALPEGFNYRPFKVAVDQGGRIYVLADGIYDGLVEFAVDGKFRGFLGAPLVRPTILERFWARIATKEQRSRMALFLPTEYSALDLDERGFLYVAEHNQVRRLNPSGTDVLRRNGFFEPLGDVPTAEEYSLTEAIRSSSFVDIVARENGLYSVLDRQRGRVFTYESDGHLLYVFGGLGTTRDTLRVPVALDALEDKILVVDRGGNRVLVYGPTTYGKLIHAAIAHYQGGDYQRSATLWAEVLQHNFNFDMAYTGIGTALLRQDRFAEAMANFRLGNNRPQYSTAFALYRREVMAASFGSVVLGILALVAVIVAGVKLRPRLKRQNEAAATGFAPVRNPQGYWQSLTYTKHVIFHPFDGFWDLKHEKRGTMGAALSVLGLVAVTYVVMRQYTGFIFNPRDL
ncbi:MAG: NHL repeat-containing protein, partial [Limnochordia bacterium]|nr:NHL repeat-containing protein [Limnochordia bacterium]